MAVRIRMGAHRVARLTLLKVGLSLGLATVVWVGPAKAACADVALVLAIDASGSVSGEEFKDQIAGYATALMSDRVLAAFEQAGVVDVAAVFWADSAFGPQVIPWQRMGGNADVEQFAAGLLATERRVTGNTDIGVGIRAALELFSMPGQCAERQVIDVSGDGRASIMARRMNHVALGPVRRQALEMGVVINGLAITSREEDLADYYRANVAGGLGAFVLEVQDMAGFEEALAQKLKKELIAHLQDGHPCASAQGPFRCLPS